MEQAIAASGLTKHYGDVRALVGLDLVVPAGQVFGFLGPNGAGKSTTIRLLMDHIRPTAGSVRVLGLDAHRDSIAIRRRVGYLPGEVVLYERMTGHQFLTYAANLRGGASARADLPALVARFGIDLSREIRSLSRGNKQKVGIAHAFMHHPELLILDEPTAGLDPLMQQEFYALVRETRDDGGTVFMSSHNLPEVDQVADRVGIIRQGSLVAIEETEALKARAPRRLEVRMAAGVAAGAAARLATLPGVGAMEVMGDTLRCVVAGALDQVVKALAEFEVVDLIAPEPSLEEVFLAHYELPPSDDGSADVP